MKMNWWRAYHGMPENAKLAFIAHAAGARRCEVGWVWVILLDRASQSEPRGHIDGLDVDVVSYLSDIPRERVEAIMAALRSKGVIGPDNSLTTWEERQPKREREDDNSGDRVQAFRERKRHVTPCNAMKRPEESRGDERREEEPPNPHAPDGAFSETPTDGLPSTGGIVVRPDVPTRGRKSGKRTTTEIARALGERLPWWECCWKIYPCRDGMNPAMDAFERRVNDKELAVKIYRGVERYAAKCASDPTIKVKYFQGWLNDERWTDEATPIVTKIDAKVEARRRALEAM